jgi:hypothetical protein
MEGVQYHELKSLYKQNMQSLLNLGFLFDFLDCIYEGFTYTSLQKY